MASTTLQVGGAVGLAVLVAVAGTGGHGLSGADLLDGVRAAVYVIAAGICLGAVAILALRRPARPIEATARHTAGPARPLSGSPPPSCF